MLGAATAEPAAGATAAGATGAAAEPGAGAAVEPAAGASAEPVAGATAEPVAGATAEPVAGTAEPGTTGGVAGAGIGAGATGTSLRSSFGLELQPRPSVQPESANTIATLSSRFIPGGLYPGRAPKSTPCHGSNGPASTHNPMREVSPPVGPLGKAWPKPSLSRPPPPCTCHQLEPMGGNDPPTYGLRNRCSTTELHRPVRAQ